MFESLLHLFPQEPTVGQVRDIFSDSAQLKRITLLNHEKRQELYDQWIAVLHDDREHDLFKQTAACLLHIPDPFERGQHIGLIATYVNGGGIRRYMEIDTIASQSLESFEGEQREVFLIGIRLWNQNAIIDEETGTISFPDVIPEYPINPDEMFVPEDKPDNEPVVLSNEELKPVSWREVILFAGR